MDIRDLIGEATTYDKKLMLERKEPLSWLKSISAFANTQGGRLIFGVSDDGECVGLENPEKDAEDLSEIIKNSLDPVPQFDLSFQKESDKTLIVVTVAAGTVTPYYVLLKGHRDAFIRIGNESVKAGSVDLKRLVLQGAQRDWDSLSSGHKRSTFSFERLRAEYFARTKLEFVESDFESFALLASGGLLTNAGALLADKSPIRHSRVFCTRWNGLNKSNGTMEALDDDEFSGGLLSLLEDAKGFVRTNTHTKWRKSDKGEGRINYPEYPSRAVEEAITNALIHRDYLITGSEVHVDIFDDRLEVYSPGGMPSGQIVQNLDARNVPSQRRNSIIADLFQRLNLMERRGSGFDKILDAYAFESEKRGKAVVPSFRSGASEFFVILPNLNYAGEVDAAVPVAKVIAKRRPPVKTSLAEGKNAKIITRAIAANSAVTVTDLQRKTKLSRTGVSNVLSALKSAGVIRHNGPKNGGSWEIVKPLV